MKYIFGIASGAKKMFPAEQIGTRNKLPVTASTNAQAEETTKACICVNGSFLWNQVFDGYVETTT